MLKIAGKEYDELKVAKAYWEKIKNYDDECRRLATEYVKTAERRKYYRLDCDYRDPNTKSTFYVPLSDKDCEQIKKANAQIAAEYSEYNEDEDERIDALSNAYFETGIKWDKYINEELLRTEVDDEYLRITKIDFSDIKHYCRIYVDCQLPLFVSIERDVDVSDEEYIEMLEIILFNGATVELSIFKYFDDKLFNHILDDLAIRPDLIYHAYLADISKAAKTIREHHKLGNIPGLKHSYFDKVSTIIEENKDMFNSNTLLWENFIRQTGYKMGCDEFATLEEWEKGSSAEEQIIRAEELKACEL